MKKKMIALRLEPPLKAFLQEYADKEQRNFTTFMVQAALQRIKQTWGVEWEEVRLSYLEKDEPED